MSSYFEHFEKNFIESASYFNVDTGHLKIPFTDFHEVFFNGTVSEYNDVYYNVVNTVIIFIFAAFLKPF